MALPVAPLGQLPSMNMPYSRPYYEKTSALDKALAAFLTGLAANAGGQFAENAMQRDFAADPAGFWSKLTQGPKQNRQQFEAAAGRQAEAQSQAERIAAQERIAEADRQGAESRLSRQLADRENERGMERTLFDLQGQRQREAMTYEADQRRRLAAAGQSGQLQNILYEYNLRNWLAGQNQPRELEQIRAANEARRGSGMFPWSTQPGGAAAAQPTQELTPTQTRALATSTAPTRASTPEALREEMRNSWLAKITSPTRYFKGNKPYVEPERTDVPELPTVEEVVASGQPAPVAAPATPPVARPAAPARSIESEYLYDPLASILEWIRTDAMDTSPVQLSPATLEALRRQSRP